MLRFLVLLRAMRHNIALLLYAMLQRDTPRVVKFLFPLSLLYLISPVDIIPDTIPFLGGVDDILLFQAAMKLLPQSVREESEETVSRLAWRVKIVLFLVTLAMVLWLSFILFVIYRAIF